MKRLQRMPAGTSFERPRACKLSDIELASGRVQGPAVCSAAGAGGSLLPSNDPAASTSSNMSGSARFPKLDECAHFHYEHVELANLEVSMSGSLEQQQTQEQGSEQPDDSFAVRVTSGDACWTLQRSYDNLVMFDRQLHRCIFDRKFSMLPDLGEERLEAEALADYLERFSALSHEGLNCGPVLNWLQLDNRGRRILVPEADSCPINTPAVAAAYAVRPYRAQAQDELSFQVGDMISVIDMPPAGESSWWRGKHGFAVGFFPAECVAVIGEKLPRHLGVSTQMASQRSGQVLVQTQGGPYQGQGQLQLPLGGPRMQPVKPVLRKHGKLIAFFRSFILNRPSRRRLKQSGILRERVFGCDLGEHLLNSGQEVPCVLRCCAEFIERHGLVDGIYRLSGVSSNIQRLRHAFDEDRLPALHSDEAILQDIHSVASLLKMYFRELPNPLCTYQLYASFVTAVQPAGDGERLGRMRDAVRKLPPPHYRTLEYLMRHLVRVAARGHETGMTARNVAIVWAPNLLRCKELEVGGVAALQGVGVQAVVTEFLICYAELIFAVGPSEPGEAQVECAGACLPGIGQRPKSLAIGAGAAPRLLSLEEARNRSLGPEQTETTEAESLRDAGPSEVESESGAGLHYHTVIELPQRKRTGSKRSPSLNWRALFGGRQSTKARAPETASRSRESTGRSGVGTATTTTATTPMAGPTSRPPVLQLRPHSEEQPNGQTQGSNEQGIALRRLRPVKSADSLDGAGHVPDDDLGPLVLAGGSAAPGTRTTGHSRSVSHDSYFEQLADLPSSGSALDLSDIQLSFDLEEREMRMLSGDDSSSARHSLEASPRRQRLNEPKPDAALGPPKGSGSAGGGGGSKRKRSRLEERLHCDVELRFIDSQSPDQVMVSAELQEMETPSPLATPGYLPLLSEASTPLTPLTSPATISPRISFKSFLLPLEVDSRDRVTKLSEESTIGTSNLLQSCITKATNDQESSATLNIDCNTENLPAHQTTAMDACEIVIEQQRPETREITATSSLSRQNLAPTFISLSSDVFDQEMMPCETLCEYVDLPRGVTGGRYRRLDTSSKSSSILNETRQPHKENVDSGFSESETVNKINIDSTSNIQNNNTSDLSGVSLNSLTTYAQSCENSSISNFIPIDSKDKTQNDIGTSLTSNSNSNVETVGNWSRSDVTSGSMSCNKKDKSLTQETSNSDVANILSDRECLSSSTIPDHCQVSMCYLESNNAYFLEKNLKPTNSNFNPSCIIDDSNATEIRNMDQTDEMKLHDLMSLEKSLPHVNHNKGTNQNIHDNCQENTSITNFAEYQNEQIQSQIPNWKPVINDTPLLESNQNLNDECSNNEEINNAFFNRSQSKRFETTELFFNQQEKINIETQNEESKESKKNYTSFPSKITSCSNNICTSNNEYHSNHSDQESNNSNNVVNSLQDDLEVVIPSESAATEPQEMAHVPIVLSESIALDSSCSISSKNTSIGQESVPQKDTATILQELALQRLSGGDRVDLISSRRRYETDFARDRRSFDSEIGREIVREHKMKQELENARGKLDESLIKSHIQTVPTSQLPPCLRARHARATRATLSRSLDEAKFNRMTGSIGCEGIGGISCYQQNKSEAPQQHGSTPNVGSKLSSQSGISERSTQSLNKNLGLDLDDPRCRERIEKYKEERRTFLRDKYRSESFRAAATANTAASSLATSNKEDGEQALLARLKQRTSRPSLL